VKLASNMDGLIWVIIFVVVTLVKGFTKLQKPATKDPADADDEIPSVARPRPPRLPPQPRPQMRPRPALASAQRVPASPQRTAAPMGPRPIAKPASEARRIDADQIRRFIEQLGGQSAPQQTAVPPPISKALPLPPPKPEPTPEAPDTKQTIGDAPASAKPLPATRWAQALRDRQNIRNIVIASEIIGKPKGELT
jgi:hypothetical protein